MPKTLLLFVALLPPFVLADWTYSSYQQYYSVSTLAKGSDQFGALDSIDLELIISYDLKADQYSLGFIGKASLNSMCPRFNKPEIGQQAVVDFGVADVNGTYIQFEAVCIGTYFPETKGPGDWTSSATTHWIPEFQPKNNAGTMFIVSELRQGNDLAIVFEQLQLPVSKFTHSVAAGDFDKAHENIERRKKAL
ncbi:TPA: hypothetical protein ACGUTA_004513 [Vibrio vulnificus]